jgi:hypothetical protein
MLASYNARNIPSSASYPAGAMSMFTMTQQDECEQQIVAGVLQRALYQSRLLSSKYEEQVKNWAIDLGQFKIVSSFSLLLDTIYFLQKVCVCVCI